MEATGSSAADGALVGSAQFPSHSASRRAASVAEHSYPWSNVTEEEIALTGGRVTAGVVRVGSTVRRPVGSNAAFVHELLRNLADAEFPYSPRFLGIDSHGREILSYVEGTVPSDLGLYSAKQLRVAAGMISRLHATTASISLSGENEVVCHGDLSPCNFVFRGEQPVAMIDFDSAHAGSRRIDVGYALWTWLEIGNPARDATETGEAIAQFCTDYGAGAPSDPLAAIHEAQEWLVGRCGPDEFGRGVAGWARRSQDWLSRNHSELINSI